jgi:hypothetical protein
MASSFLFFSLFLVAFPTSIVVPPSLSTSGQERRERERERERTVAE